MWRCVPTLGPGRPTPGGPLTPGAPLGPSVPCREMTEVVKWQKEEVAVEELGFKGYIVHINSSLVTSC